MTGTAQPNSAPSNETRASGSRQPAKPIAPLTSPASQTTARRAEGAAGEQAAAPAPAALALRERTRGDQLRAVLVLRPDAGEQRPAHQPKQPELSDHALIVQDYYSSGSDIPIIEALAWLTATQINAAIDELQRVSGIAPTLATPSHRDLLTAVRSRAREVNEPGWTQRDYDDYDRDGLQRELARLNWLAVAGDATPASASEPMRPQLVQPQAALPPGRVIESSPRWCAWRGGNATWHMTETEARIVAGLNTPAATGQQPADQPHPAHQPEQPELSDNALIVQDYFASDSNTPIADALSWLTAAEIAAVVEELRRYHHDAQLAPATEAPRWQALPSRRWKARTGASRASATMSSQRARATTQRPTGPRRTAQPSSAATSAV